MTKIYHMLPLLNNVFHKIHRFEQRGTSFSKVHGPAKDHEFVIFHQEYFAVSLFTRVILTAMKQNCKHILLNKYKGC